MIDENIQFNNQDLIDNNKLNKIDDVLFIK